MGVSPPPPFTKQYQTRTHLLEFPYPEPLWTSQRSPLVVVSTTPECFTPSAPPDPPRGLVTCSIEATFVLYRSVRACLLVMLWGFTLPDWELREELTKKVIDASMLEMWLEMWRSQRIKMPGQVPFWRTEVNQITCTTYVFTLEKSAVALKNVLLLVRRLFEGGAWEHILKTFSLDKT